MNFPNKYKGLIYGIIFTASSILISRTIFLPALSILPGVSIKNIVESIIASNDIKVTLYYTNLIYIALILIILGIFIYNSYVSILKNYHYLITLTSIYFLIHPLGFNILWAIKLNYKSDGQLLFYASETFLWSSWSFLFLGGFIDLIKRKSNDK